MILRWSMGLLDKRKIKERLLSFVPLGLNAYTVGWSNEIRNNGKGRRS